MRVARFAIVATLRRGAIVAAAGVMLCSSAAVAHDPAGTKVTWNGDIARLVRARCVRCHAPDGKGPMSLVTYDDARPWARAMREEVLTRRMPKWHAARGFGQFVNDPSLSPFEIALIVAWVDGGAVRGPEPVKLATPSSGFRPPAARVVTQPCATRTLPSGRLIAITPRLAEGGSAEFTLILPRGQAHILAWVRHFEREFEETYWLRTPIAVASGSRLQVDANGRCTVQLHFVVE